MAAQETLMVPDVVLKATMSMPAGVTTMPNVVIN